MTQPNLIGLYNNRASARLKSAGFLLRNDPACQFTTSKSPNTNSTQYSQPEKPTFPIAGTSKNRKNINAPHPGSHRPRVDTLTDLRGTTTKTQVDNVPLPSAHLECPPFHQTTARSCTHPATAHHMKRSPLTRALNHTQPTPTPSNNELRI